MLRVAQSEEAPRSPTSSFPLGTGEAFTGHGPILLSIQSQRFTAPPPSSLFQPAEPALSYTPVDAEPVGEASAEPHMELRIRGAPLPQHRQRRAPEQRHKQKWSPCFLLTLDPERSHKSPHASCFRSLRASKYVRLTIGPYKHHPKISSLLRTHI